MKKRYIFTGIIFLIMLSLFISGCGILTVSELNENKEKYLGEEISVTGIVTNTMKIGSLSGYTLKDEKTEDTIAVRSNNLPEEGKKITIKGTLMKDLVFYYILVK